MTKKTHKEALPVWDLSDLYTSLDSPELTADFNLAAKLRQTFASRYEGKAEKLDAAALFKAIGENE